MGHVEVDGLASDRDTSVTAARHVHGTNVNDVCALSACNRWLQHKFSTRVAYCQENLSWLPALIFRSWIPREPIFETLPDWERTAEHHDVWEDPIMRRPSLSLLLKLAATLVWFESSCTPSLRRLPSCSAGVCRHPSSRRSLQTTPSANGRDS